MSFKDVHVTFIIPECCEDETETSTAMQDAYAACKQNIMKVNWVREVDEECIDMQKTDFLVFQEFTGALYKKALSSKSVILGPWCLLVCLAEVKPIPNVDWPLMTMAMDGCVVVCTNISKQLKLDIKFRVQAMGGHFTNTMVSANTHLITNSVRSEKYHKAVSIGLKIVVPSWVDDVWEVGMREVVQANDDRFSKHKCSAFHNLAVCTTGFTIHEGERLRKVITENGGKHSKQLMLKNTEVLICKGTSSEKYKAACKANIDCLSAAWIDDSIIAGVAIADIEKYVMKKATSTPTKISDQIDPNFSMMSAIAGTTLDNRSIFEETMNGTTINFASTLPPPSTTKRKSPLKYCELVDGIDMKRVKRAESFLDGCSVYLAGFTTEHHDKLCKVLNFSGALRFDILSERITHIIVGDSSSQELKLIRSKNVLCPMVSVKWVIDSIEMRQPASEEEYLISVNASPTADQGSPLIKKGLRLLKADISVLDRESPPNTPVAAPTPAEEPNQDEDIMKRYMRASFTNNEDSLAAALAMNSFDTREHITRNDTSTRNATSVTTRHDNSLAAVVMNSVNTSEHTPKNKTSAATAASVTSLPDRSSPSITMSMEETLQESLLQNLKFLILNYTPKKHQNVHVAIENMGATIVGANSKSTPDYVVVPVNTSEIGQRAGEIVTDIWVNECFEKKTIVSDVLYYHKPFLFANSSIMNGFVIALSGYICYEKTFLKFLCEHLGAFVQESLARTPNEGRNLKASTHLISAEHSGKKYEGAIKWGIPVVNKDWVLDCAHKGKLVEEYEYLIGDSKENYNRTNPNNKSTSQAKLTPVVKKKLKDNTRLNISVGRDSLAKYESPGPSRRSDFVSNDTEVEQANMKIATPVHQRFVQKEMGSGLKTPDNNISTYCSQITPVNQIMKEARNNMDINMPITPKPWNHVDTPDSPLGAFICDDPPPELRKKFARWINGFPDYKEPTRRLSTPLSELKRRLWNQICPDYKPYVLKDRQEGNTIDPPNFNDSCDEDAFFGAGQSTPDACPNNKTAEEHTPENALLGEKLNQLESMLKANAASTSRRKSSVKKMEEVPTEAYHRDKESQPFSVGWDDNMNTNEVVKKPCFFMISGVDVEERETLVTSLESLGANVLDLQSYDPASTHLLCPKLNRNEKLLASMAAGKWVMHTSYVEDSLAAGKLLDEEEYEFGNPKSASRVKVDKESEKRAQCAYYWRKEISRRGYGAFHDVRCIVVANRKEPIVRVIEAGGGMVIDASPPFEDNIFATHCFLEVKKVSNFKDYIPLAQQGIFCLNTLYVNEFLHRGVKDHRDFILPSFKKYY